MFSGLSDKIRTVFSNLKSKGVLTSDDINASLRQIRIALLESDVSIEASKTLINKVKERALGAKILNDISSSQMIIKIVHEEIIRLLGGNPENSVVDQIDTLIKQVDDSEDHEKIKSADEEDVFLGFPKDQLAVIMLVGLQGSGKTTFAAKFAKYLEKNKKKVLLVSTDIYRPAAQKQLETLAKRIGVDMLNIVDDEKPLSIAKRALDKANDDADASYDAIVVDTAGRLNTDQELMQELICLKEMLCPYEIIMVADSLMGQIAGNIANDFNDSVAITGIALSKIDSDTRGGAALSIKTAIDKPIKYISYGEKMEDFGEFHPDRIASRIVGHGDIITLVEKASENVENDINIKKDWKKKGEDLDFDDILQQLETISKIGSFDSIISMIPGFSSSNGINLENGDNLKKTTRNMRALILSMTPKERRNPNLIIKQISRRNRAAKGAGLKVSDVKNIMRTFKSIKELLKKVSKLGLKGAMSSISSMLK